MRDANLTGYAAIDAAEVRGVYLHKCSDPTEGERHGLTVEEAREIAKEDPSLIWLPVDARRATPDQFAHDAGWDFSEIQTTAEDGVAEEDEEGLSDVGLTATELEEWCRARVATDPTAAHWGTLVAAWLRARTPGERIGLASMDPAEFGAYFMETVIETPSRRAGTARIFRKFRKHHMAGRS